MNLGRSIDNQRVKVISSCVRNPAALFADKTVLVPQNSSPRDGDLVLVRCLSSCGAYNHVEDLNGMPVRLFHGDVVLLVLGTRRSGTSLLGEVPTTLLQAGDTLDLVAQGGLAARCTGVPAYYGSQALPLEVIAFPRALSGKVLNLDDNPLIPLVPKELLKHPKPLLFVCGTSAEVGKTTMICNLNLSIKALRPTLRTAAIKGCGTGRSRDALNYLAANYNVVTDFVDAGLPSTYGVSETKFRSVLHTLIQHCSERADLVVVEIGGDFLEGHAPAALSIMSEYHADCVMMVNDAMGALEGMRRLKALHCEPLMIGTYKQNLQALAPRLGVAPELVADSADPSALQRLQELLLGQNLSRPGISITLAPVSP